VVKLGYDFIYRLFDTNQTESYIMIIRKELVKIDDEVKKCIKCGSMVEKFDKPNTISFCTNKDILLLGEAPANNGWRKSGKAWHDVNGKLIPSGKNLNELFATI
jgi:uracil-DNA glycosylase